MKIGCVLVLYNPDVALLERSVRAIYDQVDLIYLSDNSTINTIPFWIPEFEERCFYAKMPGNIGIAAAQNSGINYFIDHGYDYILFLDQDSVAPSNIVSELLQTTQELDNKGILVGGIGPRLINRSSGEMYTALVKKGESYDNGIVEVSEIISSGSLISIDLFSKVGLLDSSLFIDGVDHEWCWRAKQFQLRFFITERVKLSHQLGEGDRSFLFIHGINIPTPFRCYYLYRNYLFLLKRRYVPLYWKISRFVILFSKAFYLCFFISPTNEYKSNIIKGVKDGLKLYKSK